MRCAWQAYLNLLPHRMRGQVDMLGKETLQELRLRCGYPPEMVLGNKNSILTGAVTKEDLRFVINAVSAYSPWTATTVKQGYITAQGGHRVGVCGQCTLSGGRIHGISSANSLCLRVARDFPGIAHPGETIPGSILIIGPPGSGKTTLLRDLIRQKSDNDLGSVSVVDEREELFPMFDGQACFSTGKRTDVISGCGKQQGIEAVLRSMNPRWIAVDEITAAGDCEALLHAGWCGVNLLATAHAASVQDLKTRPVYRPLLEYKLFTTVFLLHRDKSWTIERMEL